MVAISLVSLTAILDPPRNPDLLFGWWNLWREVETVYVGSPFLG